MAISVILLFLNTLVLMVAMGLIFYVSPHRHLPSIKWLMVLISSFCLASFFTLGVYVCLDIELKIIFSRMRFLGLGLMPGSWILFLSTVFGRVKWIQNKYVAAIIFLPGFITALLNLTPWRELILKDFSPINIDGFSVLKFSSGQFFPFYYFWSMSLVLFSIGVGIYIFLKEKGLGRRQIVILTICSSIAAAIDIYSVISGTSYRWVMLASGTFIISLLGITYSVLKLRLFNIVPLALKRVFHEFPDPVIILDSDSTVRLANQSAIDLLGVVIEPGKKVTELLPKFALDPGEFSTTDSLGQKHYFNLAIEKLEAEYGEVSGRVMFFRQITAQKAIERRLDENLEFKVRLLALVAHDLSGHIENQALLSLSIQEEVDDSFFKEKVGLMASSALATQGFVENIMSWVRTQGTQFDPVIKNFEWNILIKECIEDLNVSIKLKNLEVSFDSTNSPLIGAGDSDMLSAVIRNILSNAIRATLLGKKIYIYLHESEKNVEVMVKDEGIGMSEEALNIIRNSPNNISFQQNHLLKTQSYGIGLMIVKQFISLHKGNFYIESELGVGTKVSFYIPNFYIPG